MPSHLSHPWLCFVLFFKGRLTFSLSLPGTYLSGWWCELSQFSCLDCVVIRGGSCHACHPASLVYFWNTFVHVSGSCLFVVRLTLPVLVQPALNSVHGFVSPSCCLLSNRIYTFYVFCLLCTSSCQTRCQQTWQVRPASSCLPRVYD